MTVQPYTSPHDPTPFDPNASDGGGGGSSVPANSAVPELAMAFTTAPGFEPAVVAGGSGSPNDRVPQTHPDFAIDLGSLLDAINAMISAAAPIVDGYEALKQQFEGGKDTVFGQHATVAIEYTGDAEYGGSYSDSKQWSDDPIASSARTFADGENGKPGMNDVQAYALKQIANSMALVGEFMALMNGAGFSYASADANSILQPPSPPGPSS